MTKTLLELSAILILVYGFAHEDKVVNFEQKIKRIFRRVNKWVAKQITAKEAEKHTN